MPLNLASLDEKTRSLMVEEIERDVAAGRLYMSPRLSEAGHAQYPELLKQSARSHDEAWLAIELSTGARMNSQEQRRTPKGGTTLVKVPVTAPDTLAEGEFNRFYIRAVCLRAQQENTPEVVVYRARYSDNPRSESERKIGTQVSAQALLSDLRSNPGVDTALGLPPGPNSGLSVKLPQD